ncbi:MAG: hypothetical protein K2G44_04280 [Clostridia bacterium]|nr:hypothetical protein [Clostridia bacterium]
MISKVSEVEKNSIIERLSFFDFDNLECPTGEKIVVSIQEGIVNVRYIDLNYTTFEKSSFIQYKKNEQTLQKFIKMLMGFLQSNSRFVFKYDEKWVKNGRLSKKLYRLFVQKGISDNDNVLCIKDKKIVSDITNANFRNNTLSYFVFLEDEIIIVPTDHMDIFIFGKTEKMRDIREYLKKNLYQFQNLEMT